MYQTHSIVYSTKEERFNKKIPLSTVASLAVVQMLTTFTIFALEIGHNILHMKLTNLFVGFWTTIPFTILWISMFAVACCCRRQSCATHAVVQNIVGLVFASILILINMNFIRYPNKCFFSDGICRRLTWTTYISEPIECLVDGLATGCGHTRITLILAQLIAGILLAITCLIYLTIYTIISLRASKPNQCQAMTTAEPSMSPIYPINSKSIPMTVNHQHQTYTLSSQPYAANLISMPVYSPQTSTLPSDGNYVNYITPNPYSTIYPTISNERF